MRNTEDIKSPVGVYNTNARALVRDQATHNGVINARGSPWGRPVNKMSKELKAWREWRGTWRNKRKGVKSEVSRSLALGQPSRSLSRELKVRDEQGDWRLVTFHRGTATIRLTADSSSCLFIRVFYSGIRLSDNF